MISLELISLYCVAAERLYIARVYEITGSTDRNASCLLSGEIV